MKILFKKVENLVDRFFMEYSLAKVVAFVMTLYSIIIGILIIVNSTWYHEKKEATKPIEFPVISDYEMAEITDPGDAWNIFKNTSGGSKIEMVAYDKWEELMLKKITKNINNLRSAYEAYYEVYYSNLEMIYFRQTTVYLKWKEIILMEITSAPSDIENTELLYNIYLDSRLNDSEIQTAAYNKFKKIKER